MIILRDKQFSWKDLVRDVIVGASKEISGRNENASGDNNKVCFGILVISRFIDKSRFFGKKCKFSVDPDNSVKGNWGNSSINWWDLSEKFEPVDSCPSDWKKFTIVGIPEDSSELEAEILGKDGHVIKGIVKVELR